MKLPLAPYVPKYNDTRRNHIGVSTAGQAPRDVAEGLAAALRASGLEVECFQKKSGWGAHDQWDVVVKGAVRVDILPV